MLAFSVLLEAIVDNESERMLLAQANEILKEYGGRVTGIAPQAVGVQGDERTYEVGITITLPPGLSNETIAMISTLLTNRVREINRVLLDVPFEC